MKKVTKMVLMLCFVLSGALCYAHGVARTEVKGDGTPSIVIIKAQCGGTDKSNSIIPSINGNVLSVLFSENLGQVTVEITTVAGATVDYASTITPNGIHSTFQTQDVTSSTSPFPTGMSIMGSLR